MASPIKRNNKLTAPNGYAGNIFGVSNCASFGKEKITTQTSTGALTTQPGTPTGMNPANISIVEALYSEIDGIRSNIDDIMSQNTKLV